LILAHHDYRWFSSVQSLIRVQLFETPWTAACQASLSITNTQSLLKLMSIQSVMPTLFFFFFLMPSNQLILCHPLLLLPSIFPNIRVFSNESALRIKWPKYWRQNHLEGLLFIFKHFIPKKKNSNIETCCKNKFGATILNCFLSRST